MACNNTTTDMTAEQTHTLGPREVARIETETDGLLHQMGRKYGTVRERLDALRAEVAPPKDPNPDPDPDPDPDPRPPLQARYTAAVRVNEKRAQALFNPQPHAPVEVRRVPALTQRTASAHHTQPAPDGSRAGIFCGALPEPTYNTLGPRSLVVHKAVAGEAVRRWVQEQQA